MSLRFRQGIPDLGLFIERDTERTPDHVNFYVFQQGRRMEGPFRSLRAAQSRYQELKVELGYRPPERPLLSPEEEHKAWLAGRAEYDRLKHDINSAEGQAKQAGGWIRGRMR